MLPEAVRLGNLTNAQKKIMGVAMHVPEGRQVQWAATLPPILMVGLVLPSVCWIFSNDSLWPYDEAWYGEVTLDLWYALTHHPLHWPKLMLKAFGSKAPGIAWFGQFFVPVGQMSGSAEIGLLLSIVFVQLATLLLSYRIGLEISGGDRLVGVAGSFFVAAAPLFVGLSTKYYAEPLQLFAVTYFFWIACTAYRCDRMEITTHLVLATAIALAAKISSPLYCLFPGLIGIFYFRRSPHWINRKPGSAQALRIWCLALSIVLLSLIIAWYLDHAHRIASFVMRTSSGDIALDYGRKAPFFNKAAFWLSSLQRSFFMPEALLGFGFLLVVMLVSMLGSPKTALVCLKNRTAMIAAAGAAHTVAVFTAFSLSVNEEQRYLLPLLPSLLVVLVWLLSCAPKRWFSAVAILIAAGQCAAVQAQVFTVIPKVSKISEWLMTPTLDSVQIDELTRLVHLTCTASTQNQYIICGVEYPWLNANSLSFRAAKERFSTNYRCYYTSIGYAQTDIDRVWRRFEDLKIAYFISVEEQAQPQPPDFLNQVSIPTLKRIKTDPQFAREPFDSRFSIVVFRKASGS